MSPDSSQSVEHVYIAGLFDHNNCSETCTHHILSDGI